MFDNYEEHIPVGVGGGGTVWKVKKKGRYYALKTIQLGPMVNNKSSKIINSEVNSLRTLKDPGVVRIYSSTLHENILCIEMDYVQGKSLDKLIYSNSLPYEDGIQHMLYILGTMNYVHNQKITHLDIKPANIILRDDGIPILVDFGCSVLLKTNKNTYSQLTNPQGTPGYIAPEIILEAKKFNPRLSDIYSLGATLYTLLTQKTVYDTASKYLYEKCIHENTPIIPPHQINKKIPKALSEICMKALDKNPNNRYSTCNAFRKAIETMKPVKKKKPFFKVFMDILLNQKQPPTPIIKPSSQQIITQETNSIYDNLSRTFLKELGDVQLNIGMPLINMKFQGGKLLTFTETPNTKLTQCQVFSLNDFQLIASSNNGSSPNNQHVHVLGYNSSQNFFGYSLKNDFSSVAVCLDKIGFTLFEVAQPDFAYQVKSRHLITYNNEKTPVAVASDDLLLSPYIERNVQIWNSKTRVYSHISKNEFSSIVNFLQHDYLVERCHFFSLYKELSANILIAQANPLGRATTNNSFVIVSQLPHPHQDGYRHKMRELSSPDFHDLTTALIHNTFLYSRKHHQILAPTENGYSSYSIEDREEEIYLYPRIFKDLVYDYTIQNDSNLTTIALLPNEAQIVSTPSQPNTQSHTSYFYATKNKEYQSIQNPNNPSLPILSSCITMSDDEGLLAIPFIVDTHNYKICIYQVKYVLRTQI